MFWLVLSPFVEYLFLCEFAFLTVGLWYAVRRFTDKLRVLP